MGLKLRRWLRPFASGKWSGWPQVAYRRDHYQRRLSAVQAHFADCLDQAAPGPVRVVSLCAGDGRDVIGVLQTHRRRSDVEAWLVELNPQSVAGGIRQMEAAGLDQVVRFVNADASDYSTYKNIVPCDIVLVCGVWGHVPSHDRACLVRGLASFCKPGGSVIWTRGISKGIARLDEIQSQFNDPSWTSVRQTMTPDERWVIATHRYCGASLEPPAAGRLFHFRKNAG